MILSNRARVRARGWTAKRASARKGLALLTATTLGLAGCQQDDTSDAGQVCAFQCDYTDANAVLTVADVVQILANAITEARANGITDVTISVNDHLNNVLAVYDTDASTIDFSLITSKEDPGSEDATLFEAFGPTLSTNFGRPGPTPALADALNTALDGIYIPSGYAAISKAGTANYFSTQGNAFTTRTANTLIQQNFVPGETDRPGGPLFGVQIAQLVCSDINTRQSVNQLTDTSFAPDPNDLIGPRRLPVGFAADPGGVPLYKDGIPELEAGLPTGRTGKVVVGAVGVEFNHIYALDKNATNADRNLEERIAVGATRGFEADRERQATRITVAGRALRFTDDGQLRSRPTDVPTPTAGDLASTANIQAFLDGISGRTGDFVNDEFFFPFDAPRQGVRLLDPASGVVAATLLAPLTTAGQGLANAQGEILVDRNGNPRFPAIDSLDPTVGAGGLTDDDVQELLVNSLLLAERTRAQTRTPLGGQARIDVAVVDLDGNVLGFARSQDALLDGIDVTIAKTRQAAFFSKNDARTQLENARDPLGNSTDPATREGTVINVRPFEAYVDTAADFLGFPAPVLAADPPFNGDFAWSSIALGAISNPDFPPGVLDAGEGPLSRREGEWSIFSTGLQTEVVLPGIALGLCDTVPDLTVALRRAVSGVDLVAEAVLYQFDAAGIAARNAACDAFRTTFLGSADPGRQLDCMQGVQDFGVGAITGLQNGFHIFQGAVPIYRGNTLVGAIGVSGDGAEQDDFVPFVALDEVGKDQQRRGVPAPIGNAPGAIRANRISVQNVNLRYVVCPTAPFLTSNEQNGCEGR